MLEINPSIKAQNLHSRPFLKQIAAYISVTVHTVEIRKARSRKKYNIPSEIDNNAWMKNLIKYIGFR